MPQVKWLTWVCLFSLISSSESGIAVLKAKAWNFIVVSNLGFVLHYPLAVHGEWENDATVSLSLTGKSWWQWVTGDCYSEDLYTYLYYDHEVWRIVIINHLSILTSLWRDEMTVNSSFKAKLTWEGNTKKTEIRKRDCTCNLVGT